MKISSVLLCLAAVLALASCSEDDSPDSSEKDTSSIPAVSQQAEESSQAAEEPSSYAFDSYALPADVVRRIIGDDKIIGVSTAKLDEALKAVKDGADYLGVGAMYSTDTKTDARPVTMEELKEIRKNVDIPIVVIGGINMNTLGNFKNMGIDGLAVVSAIVAQPDVEKAAKDMYEAFTS